MSGGKPIRITKSNRPEFSYKPLEIVVDRPFSGEKSFKFLTPESTLDSSVEQNLTFQCTVPRGHFFLFHSPCCYVTFEVRKQVKTSTAGVTPEVWEWQKVTAEDNVVLKCPQAYIKSIYAMINNTPLPTINLHDDDLWRMIALNLRLSCGDEYDAYKDDRSLFYLKHLEDDVNADVSKLGRQGKAWITQVTENSFAAPIYVPMWPLNFFLLESCLSRRKLGESPNKTFGEDTRIFLSVNTSSADNLKRFLHQASKTAADALKLSVKVTDFFFVIESESFPEGHTFLEQYRKVRNTRKLLFPIVELATQRWYLDQGANTSMCKFSNNQCNWRFFILVFKKPADDGNAATARNATDFSFPEELVEFDIRIDGTGESIIDGPIQKIGQKEMHPSKLLYFHKMQKFLRRRLTYFEYFRSDCCDQMIIVDLMPQKIKFGSYTNIPTLAFILKWSDTLGGAPQNLSICAFGAQNGAVEIAPSETVEVVPRVLPR